MFTYLPPQEAVSSARQGLGHAGPGILPWDISSVVTFHCAVNLTLLPEVLSLGGGWESAPR